MTSGEMVIGVAMTEPGTGSDLQAVRTTAATPPSRMASNETTASDTVLSAPTGRRQELTALPALQSAMGRLVGQAMPWNVLLVAIVPHDLEVGEALVLRVRIRQTQPSKS